MKKELSIADVKNLIMDAEFSLRHEECTTCECYLGYITQLKIDADPEAKQYLTEYMPARDQIHSCLGCDPCSAGILYTNYLQKKPSELE